jgi:hypothetical protein
MEADGMVMVERLSQPSRGRRPIDQKAGRHRLRISISYYVEHANASNRYNSPLNVKTRSLNGRFQPAKYQLPHLNKAKPAMLLFLAVSARADT